MACSWYHYVHSNTWEEMLMLMLTMKWMHAIAARCILACSSCICRSTENREHPHDLLVSHSWWSPICTRGSNRMTSPSFYQKDSWNIYYEVKKKNHVHRSIYIIKLWTLKHNQKQVRSQLGLVSAMEPPRFLPYSCFSPMEVFTFLN